MSSRMTTTSAAARTRKADPAPPPPGTATRLPGAPRCLPVPNPCSRGASGSLHPHGSAGSAGSAAHGGEALGEGGLHRVYTFRGWLKESGSCKAAPGRR